MKPFKIVLYILGLCFVTVAVTSMTAKVRFIESEKKIHRLLTEIKSLGIPTHDGEAFHTIPDSENSWIEVKSSIARQTGSDTYPFRSQLPAHFLNAATAKDLSVMRKFLAVNQLKRQAALEAIVRKPRFQIHFEYDQGIAMSDHDNSSIRDLQTELCLSAVANALEGNEIEMLRNLGAVRKLISAEFESAEPRLVASGNAGRMSVFQALLKIAELRPDLIPQLERLHQTHVVAKTNCRNYIQNAFLKNVGTIRYYDVPGMDRSKPLFNGLSTSEEPDPSEGAKAQVGDHMPATPAVRNYLAERLEKWLPLLKNVWGQQHSYDYPEPAWIDSMSEEQSEYSRKYIDQLKNTSEISNGSQSILTTLRRNELYAVAEDVFFAALKKKRLTGSYPRSLSEMGVQTKIFDTVGGLDYSVDGGGFTMNSFDLGSSGTPRFNYSFPRAFSMKPEMFRYAKAQIAAYDKGMLAFDGVTELTPKSKGGPPPRRVP